MHNFTSFGMNVADLKSGEGTPYLLGEAFSYLPFPSLFSGSEKMDSKLWAVQSGYSQGHHPGLGETGDRD